MSNEAPELTERLHRSERLVAISFLAFAISVVMTVATVAALAYGPGGSVATSDGWIIIALGTGAVISTLAAVAWISSLFDLWRCRRSLHSYHPRFSPLR